MQFNSITLPSQAIVPVGVALAHLILTVYILSRRQIKRDKLYALFVAYLCLTILWNINLLVVFFSTPVDTFLDISWVELAPYGLVGLAALYWGFVQIFFQQLWPKYFF